MRSSRTHAARNALREPRDARPAPRAHLYTQALGACGVALSIRLAPAKEECVRAAVMQPPVSDG